MVAWADFLHNHRYKSFIKKSQNNIFSRSDGVKGQRFDGYSGRGISSEASSGARSSMESRPYTEHSYQNGFSHADDGISLQSLVRFPSSHVIFSSSVSPFWPYFEIYLWSLLRFLHVCHPYSRSDTLRKWAIYVRNRGNIVVAFLIWLWRSFCSLYSFFVELRPAWGQVPMGNLGGACPQVKVICDDHDTFDFISDPLKRWLAISDCEWFGWFVPVWNLKLFNPRQGHPSASKFFYKIWSVSEAETGLDAISTLGTTHIRATILIVV